MRIGMALLVAAFLFAGALLVMGTDSACAEEKVATEYAAVEVVEVPVTVTGKDGAPVPDLKPEEFIVKDNGQKQTLLFAVRVDSSAATADDLMQREPGATSAAEPIGAFRSFIFLFDLTFNDPASLQAARAAAVDFVTNQLGANDYAAVFTLDTGSGVTLLMNFTRDRRQLQDAILSMGSAKGSSFVADSAGLVRLTTDEQRLQQGMQQATEIASGVPLTPGLDNPQARRDMKRSDIQQYRGMVGAYLAGFSNFATGIDILEGRKIVIFFSKGFDTKALTGMSTKEAGARAEGTASGQFEQMLGSGGEAEDTGNIDMLDQIVKALAAADCRVFSVDPGGAQLLIGDSVDSTDLATRSRTGLEMLSSQTGGTVFSNTTDLAGVMKQIDKATSSYYLLAYKAPASGKGKYHKIDVDITRSGVDYTHRKGYYESKPYEKYSGLEKQLQIASIVTAGAAPGGIEFATAAFPFPACVKKDAAAGGAAPAGRCAVVLEIPSETLAKLDVGQSKEFDVYAFAVEKQSGSVRGYLHGLATVKDPKKAAGLRYTDVMDLVPGQAEVRTIVRNRQTGATAMGRASVAMEAPESVRAAACFLSEKSTWENVTSKDVAGECHPFSFKGKIAPALAVPDLAAGGEISLLLKVFGLAKDASGKPDLNVQWYVTTEQGATVSIGSYKFLQGDWPTSSEYDLVFSLTAPPQLRPGTHRLGVRVTDQIRKTSGVVWLPFRAVAGS